ncbi:MAG: nuclease [Spirosoma sp.]|nr:nuclease [Spirosoma sp.]
MTNEEPKRSDTAAEIKPLFTDEINPLLADLFYPSESDEPIEPVTCYLNQPEPLTVSQIKDWLMLPPSVYVEERPETEFWAPITTEQDWYDDEEKARTARSGQLKKRLEDELTVRQVFRVGESEIDVYLLGRQADGQRAGIKTKVVAT